MSDIIPEIATRISVKIDTDNIDSIIITMESDDILSQIGISEVFLDIKNAIENTKEPMGNAIAESLKSNQEMIIRSKHYKTGLMANSVEISREGDDFVVGNTARSSEGFPYPLSIEFGRREIFPSHGGVLRWFDGDTPVFSRYSSATSPDPFVEPSIHDTMNDLDGIIDDILKEV